jgi:predicted membrane channel-forming protein YqfA (hemolysin III family)
MGVWFLVFASSSQLWLAVASMFLASVGFPLVFATALGLVQVIASPEMRARQLSLFLTVSFGIQPIASLLIGLDAELLTTAVAIQLNGVLLLAGAALFAARADFRKWQAASPQDNRDE